MSLIRWAYEALCINEFSGMTLQPKSKHGMLSVSTGEQVLESLGCAPSAGSSVVRALKYQAAIIAANYLFTLVSLLRQKPAFEKIADSPQPPPASSIEATASASTSGSLGNKPTAAIKPPARF